MPLYNLVRVHCATRGTGVLTLGEAVEGWLDFTDVADGQVTYTIRNGSQTEIGHGVYDSAAGTLTRSTVLKSTNSDAAIDIDDECEVALTISAEDFTAAFLPDGDYGDLTVASSGAVWTIDADVISAYGRTLTVAADAAAARTVLGLGTMATATAGDYFTAAQVNAIVANYQPLDADLTTWAGLTPSANAQSLVTAANYAAMRTLLGLVIGTNVQAYDADLTTWAGLTPSANAQSLVTAADYAAMRTQLGLVIGTNVQAYDADLTTWAGLTPSANAQSLVTAADYSAMRTLLSLVPGTNVQAYDANLLSWAGVTRASGFDTFAATPSSANLRALLNDEVGTGAAYFVGGALGTPASGTATNLTGLPLTSGVTGTLPIGNGGTGATTAAGATAALNAFTGDSGAGGVKGLVPAPATGDAAAAKFLKADGTWTAPSGSGDVVGPAASVDNEITLFSGTTGKLLKRASTTGLLKGTSGVLSAATAGTDYYAPGGTDVALADGGTGASTAAAARINLGVRDVLTAARTYYVRTDGSDSNDGLTNVAGGAFLTIQKAVDVVAAIDLAAYSVTIQVGNGTYTGAITLKSYIGTGPVTITGDTTTPANVTISTTSANAFIGNGVIGKWQLAGLRLQTTTSGSCINLSNGCVLELTGNMTFGACAGHHMIIQTGSVLICSTNYSITGSATNRHFYASQRAEISISGSRTITLTGTPSFDYFALSDRLSMCQLSGITFSGSATGTRYHVGLNSVLYTNAGGANYFPGSIAGSAVTGGQYA